MPTTTQPKSWLSLFPNLNSYHQSQKTISGLVLAHNFEGDSWAGTRGGYFSVRNSYHGFSLQTRALPGICSVRFLSYTSVSFGKDVLENKILTNYALSWFNDLLSGPYASLVWVGYNKEHLEYMQKNSYIYGNYGDNLFFKTLLAEMRLEGGYNGGHFTSSVPYKMCFYVRDKFDYFKLLKETDESSPDIRGESIQPEPTENPQVA